MFSSFRKVCEMILFSLRIDMLWHSVGFLIFLVPWFCVVCFSLVYDPFYNIFVE